MIPITMTQILLLIIAFMIFIFVIVNRICRCVERKWTSIAYAATIEEVKENGRERQDQP